MCTPRRLICARSKRPPRTAACRFVPWIFRQAGPVRGWLQRMGFEVAYAINTIRRLLTIPLRPDLPSFYIVGFPKAGTTSLANQLKASSWSTRWVCTSG